MGLSMNMMNDFIKRSIEMEEMDIGDNLRITIEQRGCLAEAIVPAQVIEQAQFDLNLKEFLQNSMVDLYARLAYMMRKQEISGD